MLYSRLPITRTFKGNRKRFQLSPGSSKKIAGSKEKVVFTARYLENFGIRYLEQSIAFLAVFQLFLAIFFVLN